VVKLVINKKMLTLQIPSALRKTYGINVAFTKKGSARFGHFIIRLYKDFILTNL